MATSASKVGSLKGPKGDQGLQGIQGVKGDIGPAGPSGLTPRGTYNSATTYNTGDLVQYGGSGYYALNPPPAAGTPPTNDPNGDDTATNTGWQFLVLEGARGVQGVRGTRWFTGTGAPDTAALTSQGAINGDLYMDTSTGDVYTIAVS